MDAQAPRPDDAPRPTPSRRAPTVGVPRRTAALGAVAALATGALTGWLAVAANADDATVPSTSTDSTSTVDSSTNSSSSDIPNDSGAIFGDSNSNSSGSVDTHSGAS